MKLHGLGYVGFTATDPAEWLPFGTGVLGMMPARAVPGESFGMPGSPPPSSGGTGVGADGSVYLKMDDWQWRVGVHPGEAPGLAYLGFPVADGAALGEAIAEVTAAGVDITGGTAEEAAARGVQGLAWLTSPAGTRVELFHGPVLDLNFVSPHGVEFLAGELGLGHVLLFVADMDANLDFYRNVLGFERSDFFAAGPGMSLHFLRCTPRHHSVGLIHVAPFDAVHHLMVEVCSLDAVGAALDRATDAGCTITSTLGRHVNDRTVSFYMKGPGGFEVEVGYDSVLCGEDWIDHEAIGGDPWGHHGLAKVLDEDGGHEG